MTGPEKPRPRRLRAITTPGDNGCLLAPISATDVGLNRRSRLRTVML